MFICLFTFNCLLFYRVRAVNRAGESDPSDPSLPHKARAKNSPPRIDRHAMMDIRILAGEPLNIKVSDG